MKKILFTLLIVSLSSFLHADEKVNLSLEVAENANINIQDPHSQIEILSWEKNSMQISGEISDEASDFSFEKSGNGAIFEVEYANQKNWKEILDAGSRSRLRIYVPINSFVEVSNITGAIKVSGVKGGTSVESISASVLIEQLADRIGVETINGNIESNNNHGRLDIETVNGNFTDQSSSGELKVSTVQGNINSTSKFAMVEVEVVNGNLDLQLDKVDELAIDSVNGRVSASMSLNKKGDVTISNVNGKINLVFNKDVSAEFEIQTYVGGTIVNKLTEDKAKKEEFGPGRSLSFTTADGSAQVEVSTVGGKVSLAGH
ncbi:MAG: hypothetical protein GKR93_09260 [Gammaproteobacteria bacterium]|nr:hypothetical protein [Gammaproteobacteria bacterium]